MQYLQKSKGGFFWKTQSEQNQALSFTHPLNKYNRALQPKSFLFAAPGHVFLSAHGTLVCSYTRFVGPAGEPDQKKADRL